MKRPSLMLALIAMCLATVPPTFVACTNQGQGQRCDILDTTNNGGCEPPLFCRSRTELGGASDICCAKENGNWVLTPYDCEPHANTGSSSGGGGSMDGGGGMGGAGGASSSSSASSSSGGGASSSSTSSSSGGQDAGSG